MALPLGTGLPLNMQGLNGVDAVPLAWLTGARQASLGWRHLGRKTDDVSLVVVF